MREYWIKAHGCCGEAELAQTVAAQAPAGGTAIALYTDRFAAGESLAGLCPTKLLELRVFTPQAELWLHRTTLGRDFYWRVADDTALAANLPAGETVEEYCYDETQLLDINTERSFAQRNEAGNPVLLTTVGGTYALPIAQRDTAVQVRNYLRYDSVSGTAAVADSRYCSFGKEGK